MGIFSPKDKSYLELYVDLADKLIHSSKLLTRILSADTKDHANIASEMNKIEEQADNIKHNIAKWINNTFVTPFDRDDMYRISSSLDDVIDAYERTIDTIYLYKIDDLPKKAEKHAHILEDIAVRVYAVISGLTDVRAHANDLLQIRELVIDAEKAHRSLMAKLFSDKKDAVEIIKSKGLYDELVEISKNYKSVAAAVEQVAIKES